MMIDQFIEHLESYTSLTEEEKDYLRKHIPVRKIERNEVLLKTGDISDAFFFVLKGCLRLYYETEDEEKTAFFYIENSFASSYASFVRQTPAPHTIAAIESGAVAVISKEVVGDLLSRFPKFDFLGRELMEEEMIVYQDIISAFVVMNPEQRYQKFVSEHPELLQRIPQYYIATFLGVTPETLSRIRRRIATS